MTGGGAATNLAFWRRELLAWLTQDAYPLWSTSGVARDGGFEECLDAEGNALPLPRRLRVLPRQIYALVQSQRLACADDVAPIVRRSLAYLQQRYRRPDGLYRTLVDASGRPLDESALLYDHSFILLGFASAAQILDEMVYFESEAANLWELISTRWRQSGGFFLSADDASDAYLSNPLMHLLEACLEWSSVGANRHWALRAVKLGNLAVEHLVDPTTGGIFEKYTMDWRPVANSEGKRVIEPGHQFEWAWLLLRCFGGESLRHREAAMQLISLAERYGVKNRFVVNTISDDGTCRDADSRLWPQTERLKANLLAYELTGNEAFARCAADAAEAIGAFLRTPKRGLWYDQRQSNGHFVPSPSPASSFYHLACALTQLAACEVRQRQQRT